MRLAGQCRNDDHEQQWNRQQSQGPSLSRAPSGRPLEDGYNAGRRRHAQNLGRAEAGGPALARGDGAAASPEDQRADNQVSGGHQHERRDPRLGRVDADLAREASDRGTQAIRRGDCESHAADEGAGRDSYGEWRRR